jgi:protein arginine N-methyltransferase 1
MSPGLYDSLHIHQVMLSDHVRNTAFEAALRAEVRAGVVVLDVGAGTGILSLWAARAGARRVYAVERSTMAAVAADLVARNGLDSVITVIQAPIEQVMLPEPVDLIVSEWLGVYGVDENMLGLVLGARDRFLKPGGLMVPAAVKTMLAPVYLERRDHEEQLALGRPYGLDLSVAAPELYDQARWAPSGELAASDLIGEPAAVWSIDMARFPAAQAGLPLRGRVRFTVRAPSRVNALTAWFVADFGASRVLENAPGTRTHWGQYLFPLRRTVAVAAGESIDVFFSSIPAGIGYCHHAWSVKLGGRPWEHHDSRWPAPLWTVGAAAGST